jgi:5-dehydro-4-deoxyglucarate dehydratase
MRDRDELKAKIASGLLSFPVTDFTPADAFDPAGYARRIEWMSSFPATALFAAGGTGEMFSLGWREYRSVIATAVAHRRADLPVIAGVGYGAAMAVEMAITAQEEGADGLLLLPHYLVESTAEGRREHVRRVCDAVDIGVIYYARGASRLRPDDLAWLADRCPNLIGYKDGFGDVQALSHLVQKLGDRLIYIGGMPTAEVFARTYAVLGVSTYSSAVFNFLPDYALRFFDAVTRDAAAEADAMLKHFFLPLIELRDRREGYAVSLVKKGVEIIGRSAGHVRPPLTELDAEEAATLRALIETAGDSIRAATAAESVAAA